MAAWSPEQWVVLITGALSALGSLIAVIVHAVKSEANSREIKGRLGVVQQVQGQVLEQQVHHEKAAERRAGLPLAGRLGRKARTDRTDPTDPTDRTDRTDPTES